MTRVGYEKSSFHVPKTGRSYRSVFILEVLAPSFSLSCSALFWIIFSQRELHLIWHSHLLPRASARVCGLWVRTHACVCVCLQRLRESMLECKRVIVSESGGCVCVLEQCESGRRSAPPPCVCVCVTERGGGMFHLPLLFTCLVALASVSAGVGNSGISSLTVKHDQPSHSCTWSAVSKQ